MYEETIEIYMVLEQYGKGQNGTDKWYGHIGIRTKWYWTKWYGQNGTDKTLPIKLINISIPLPLTI